MADSVNDEDSDLISLEKLSLAHASCFDCHCRCTQKQLEESAAPASQNSSRFALCWPPRQSGGVVKASKRKATALNVDAVTKCLLINGQKSNSASSLATAEDDTVCVHDASAWSKAGAKADFGDLARLADVTIGPNERAPDFASSAAYRGRRSALDVTADRRRRKNGSKQKTDIVLTDLKDVLLAENGDVPSSCDSTLRTSSDCSQSGHHLSMPCSQQALVNDCLMDELDELTGYFEHYFHIPKKMSEMAKMMYA